MTRAATVVCRALSLVLLGSSVADAEPMFLSKQYTRCTSCHYSATGGGLLTPYGRSLSNRELSTTGGDKSQPAAPTSDMPSGEEAFLWGALGDRLGPVQLGIDMRPSHLNTSVSSFSSHLDFFMNADLLGAYRVHGWTFCGEIGRKPLLPGWKIDSYEYWIGYQSDNGFGVRVGRFLPAYGIRFADHTAFSRAPLGFDAFDQIYGVELSRTTDYHLLQVSISPGRADSIILDDGRQSLTATGRFQIDLTPRRGVVFSGRYRDASKVVARNGAGGIAFGFAPVSRLTTWTEVDTEVRQGPSDPSYIVVNETAFEAIRGLWLKFSPQVRLVSQPGFTGQVRMLFEADFLPRTHFNADLSYYRDRSRSSDIVAHVVLVQLHVYL